MDKSERRFVVRLGPETPRKQPISESKNHKDFQLVI
jgi:hypothetical protein